MGYRERRVGLQREEGGTTERERGVGLHRERERGVGLQRGVDVTAERGVIGACGEVKIVLYSELIYP